MAALAYVLLPASGALAYFGARSVRTRWHGLQAIAYGVIWALVLYGCTHVSTKVTQLAFAIGGVGWLILIVATAVGANPRLPLLGSWLRSQAEISPRSESLPTDAA